MAFSHGDAPGKIRGWGACISIVFVSFVTSGLLSGCGGSDNSDDECTVQAPNFDMPWGVYCAKGDCCSEIKTYFNALWSNASNPVFEDAKCGGQLGKSCGELASKYVQYNYLDDVASVKASLSKYKQYALDYKNCKLPDSKPGHCP
eukprot:TRINITY_DN78058_c0_g1_i1.p1 TRINITY_DN78058_c0_g1~~TRINITY_DN78058_c0_g1_i1.p1  ORF type:complete len:146 (+),score=16.86 TRINITY_DN78058_c0_g1_i1:56-493(+)